MLDLTVPTRLMDTIEKAHDYVPEQAYKLATRIASTLTQILNRTTEVVLSAEYEHMLETMALQDLPNIFNTYSKVPKNNRKVKEQADKLLIEQLLTIVNRIEQVKDEYSEELLDAMTVQSRYVSTKFAPKQVDDMDLTVDETFQLESSSASEITDVLGPTTVADKLKQKQEPRKMGWLRRALR